MCENKVNVSLELLNRITDAPNPLMLQRST